MPTTVPMLSVRTKQTGLHVVLSVQLLVHSCECAMLLISKSDDVMPRMEFHTCTISFFEHLHLNLPSSPAKLYLAPYRQ